MTTSSTTRATKRLLAKNAQRFKDIAEFFSHDECLDLIEDNSDRKFIEEIALPFCNASGDEQIRLWHLFWGNESRLLRITREAKRALLAAIKRFD